MAAAAAENTQSLFQNHAGIDRCRIFADTQNTDRTLRMDIINDLIAGKNVSNDGTTSGQAYLGISAQTITSQYAQLLNMPEGVYISSVEQGSAAEECGLQSGDIICSLDGEDIADMETFHDKIVACNPGDKVTIVYYRNNNGNYEKQTATATLKEKQ